MQLRGDCTVQQALQLVTVAAVCWFGGVGPAAAVPVGCVVCRPTGTAVDVVNNNRRFPCCEIDGLHCALAACSLLGFESSRVG